MNQQHQTFGSEPLKETKKQIEALTKAGMKEKILTLEQCLFLTQILAKLKTYNTKLRLRVREKEILIK